MNHSQLLIEPDKENGEKETSSDDYYFDIRHLVVMKINNKEEKTLDVKTNAVKVRMEPDRGAEVNVIDQHQSKALKNRAAEEIELQDSKIKLDTLRKFEHERRVQSYSQQQKAPN